jgi:3-methylfumaryl-CoA hydratase
MLEPNSPAPHLQADMDSRGRRQRFTIDLAERIAAMLDLPATDALLGDHIPFGWHFPLLHAATPRNQLRQDGFPGLGVAMPDVAGQRLVATGRTLRQFAMLPLDGPVLRTSRLESSSAKATANGSVTNLVFAHEIRSIADDTLILTEEQRFSVLDWVYALRPAEPDGEPLAAIRTVTPDETLLFLFSALSSNSHRIHLDQNYARWIEGYPDLVVNGGLTTLLMTEIVRAEFGDSVTSVKVRNLAPLFCHRPIRFARASRGEIQLVIAYDDAGQRAAEMEFSCHGL